MPRFESIIENDFFNPDSSHTHDGVNSKKIKYSDLEGTPSLDFIPNSAKGTEGGVAPLDTNKKVPKENLPADTVYDINYTHTDNNFTNALKTKLDNIEANSQVNDIETISAGNTTLPITNKNVDIPIATKTQLGLIKVGRNLSVTTDGVLSASGGTSGVVEDTLNSTSTTNALSANQGRILNNKIVANSDLISTLQEDVIGIEDNMITSVKLNNTALPKTNKEVNIPIASKTQLGVFKVGENLTISEEGILSATGGGGSSGNEVEVSEQAPTEGTVEIWVDLKEEYGFSPTIQSELYYSEEGLGTNIKLRDNPLDYDYLLIQYYTATDQPIINGCKLIPINVHVDNSYNLNENYEDTDFSYIYNARITLTGIGIEFSSNKTIKISNGRQVIENTPIIIYKVIGFKK